MERDGGDKTVIKVKVLPRSSANQIVGREKGIFRVKLTAPPVDGKANKALRDLLAKRLGVAKGNVEIISGERSKIKSVRIHGLSLGETNRILQKGTEFL
jgi:uncharacterized protein (TIGR00251 family)